MLSMFDPLSPGRIGRRELLRAGALGAVGLSLPQLLKAEAVGGQKSKKSCILIFANGGPSQLDTFDPKPHAPAEIRGEFSSIATAVPGVRICEHLPKLAALAKEYSLIRTVSHTVSGHMAAAYLALTGHLPPRLEHPVPATGIDMPAIGSVVAKFQPARPELPSYVVEPQLSYDVNLTMGGQFSGFLGAAYAPYVVNDDPSAESFKVQGLELNSELNPARLNNRLQLVEELEARLGRLGETLDGSGNGFDRLALNLLSSSAAKEAFQLNKEPEAVRDAYGRNRYGQSYLMARRLIESGVRMVLVNDIVGTNNDRWDNHGGTLNPCGKVYRKPMPRFPRC